MYYTIDIPRECRMAAENGVRHSKLDIAPGICSKGVLVRHS